MTKEPDHWGIAEVVLNHGLAGDWAVDRVMDVTNCTREQALAALKYAKEQGAGRQFDRLQKLYE